jgi:hypothetical protein
MASDAHPGSGAKNAIGGLIGAIAALIGILIGNSVANMLGGAHPPAAQHQEAGEGH